MGGDDDISAALPRPPLPAPARREAAIAAALRRFDGVGEPARNEAGRAPAAGQWLRRPYAGALAGAALVTLIAVPLAWMSLDQQPYREASGPGPRADRVASAPVQAEADADPSAPASASPRLARNDGTVPPGPVAAADEAPVPAPAEPAEPAKAASEPAPAAPSEPVPPREEQLAARSRATANSGMVVTGSRIRSPNLEEPSPVAAEAGGDDSAIVVTGTRVAGSNRRGDWNACTVEDPGRSLAGCPVSAQMADGLARAWEGDTEGAIRAFDAAIAAAPRSSFAYLNRGIARRRSGELDGALADLDRAVRYAPRAARGYYHRSLLLRQRGDVRRARADEARAVELDPRYAVAVRPERPR